MNPEESKPPDPSKKLVSWTPLLDAGWKLGLFVSIALYALGLVISNLHIQRFGRYSFGLDKAEYIIVGFLWVFFAWAGFNMFGYLKVGYETVFSKPPISGRYLKKILGGIALLLGVLFFGVFFSMVTTALQVGDFLTRTSWNIYAVVLCTGAAVDFFTRRMLKLAKEGGLSWQTFGTFSGLYNIVQYGYWVMLALIAYSTVVFPEIPAAFGGGALLSAEIFIKPEGPPFLKSMKLNVDATGSIGSWAIVVELPDAFVITDASNPPLYGAKTFWVRKDRIEALIYTKNKFHHL